MSATANGHPPAVLRQALAYLDAGLSLLPVARDGSKRPDTSRLPRVRGDDGLYHPTWDPMKAEPPARAAVEQWFKGANPPGIGVIGGAVSGGLECIDFDAEAETNFPAWCDLVEAEVPGLIARLSIARTPKPGFHVRYRCPDVDMPGNTKLAMDPAAAGDNRCLIETRGEGGYAIAPGSPAEVHKSGRLYEHHSGPELQHVQAIGIEEREVLIRAARSFDRGTPPEAPRAPVDRGPGLSPGDDYNSRGPDWLDILGPHGWALAYRRGDVLYLKRPGKDGRSWSATANHCRNEAGQGLLYVFSSNAAPLEPEKSYSKFGAYCFLNHRGDFRAAAKALIEQGYGEPRRPGGQASGKLPEGSENGQGDGKPTDREAALVTEDHEHQTDLGNARRVVRQHGADLRFCHPTRRWLVWDGARWAEDTTAEAVRYVKQTQAELYRTTAEAIRQLGDVGDDEKRKRQLAALAATLKHALKWEEAKRIASCLELAQSEPGIPVLPGDLDTDRMLLNVLNGTIDLRTGQLRPHRREDLITKLARVSYDPAAECPLWERSLARWADHNEGLITYLQRVVGYGMTADVSEQLLWLFYGPGANGKSTFLLLLLALLGDYAMQAVADLLMAKKHEAHPTERADLFGKRLVATIETEEGKRMAEALMKQLTGGDKVRARRMRQDFFEFSPTHKIILCANHKPVVRGTDHAVWRRIKLVPWTQTITDEEKDKALPDKLKGELPGILNWALRGCLDWQKEGLGEPDEVRQATAEYQAEQDTVAKFLAECCLRVAQARVKVSALYEAYGRWSGDKLTTQPEFNERLRAKGFDSKRSKNGYFWYDLALADAGDTEATGEPG
jgi:putative DNA primase/helicase